MKCENLFQDMHIDDNTFIHDLICLDFYITFLWGLEKLLIVTSITWLTLDNYITSMLIYEILDRQITNLDK